MRPASTRAPGRFAPTPAGLTPAFFSPFQSSAWDPMSPTNLRHPIAVNVSELVQIALLLRAFGPVCLRFFFFPRRFIHCMGCPNFLLVPVCEPGESPPPPRLPFSRIWCSHSGILSRILLRQWKSGKTAERLGIAGFGVAVLTWEPRGDLPLGFQERRRPGGRGPRKAHPCDLLLDNPQLGLSRRGFPRRDPLCALHARSSRPFLPAAHGAVPETLHLAAGVRPGAPGDREGGMQPGLRDVQLPPGAPDRHQPPGECSRGGWAGGGVSAHTAWPEAAGRIAWTPSVPPRGADLW